MHIKFGLDGSVELSYLEKLKKAYDELGTVNAGERYKWAYTRWDIEDFIRRLLLFTNTVATWEPLSNLCVDRDKLAMMADITADKAWLPLTHNTAREALRKAFSKITPDWYDEFEKRVQFLLSTIKEEYDETLELIKQQGRLIFEVTCELKPLPFVNRDYVILDSLLSICTLHA